MLIYILTTVRNRLLATGIVDHIKTATTKAVASQLRPLGNGTSIYVATVVLAESPYPFKLNNDLS